MRLQKLDFYGKRTGFSQHVILIAFSAKVVGGWVAVFVKRRFHFSVHQVGANFRGFFVSAKGEATHGLSLILAFKENGVFLRETGTYSSIILGRDRGS